MKSDDALGDAVRDQFALLAPAPGSPLAQAIDRACQIVEEHERTTELAWSQWLEDQRALEDAQDENRRLMQQLTGIPTDDTQEDRDAA